MREQEYQIELVEVQLNESEYEKHVVRLVKRLLEIDGDQDRDQDDSPNEVAA